MKHRFPVFVVVGLAATVLSCAHHVQTIGKPPQSEPVVQAQQVDQSKQFAGSIDRINKVAGMVTVVHWPLYKTFEIGPDCQIVIPGRENATLDNFRADDLVIVTYEDVDGVLVARRFARRSNEYIRERQEQLQRLEEMLYPSPNELGPPD